MKINKIVCFFLVTLIGACAHKPAELPLDEAPHKASRDYEAIGDSTGIRPYVYGKHTLIKFEHGKSFSPSIKDEQGASVNYKVQGGYYVLDRKLDTFTLSGSGHLVRFNLIPPKTLDVPESESEIANENEAGLQEEINAVALNGKQKSITSDPIYAIMYEQMQQQRKLLGIASSNPKFTGEELFQVNDKLDDIEYKIMQGNRAIVHVYFPFNDTVFNPDKALVDTLLPLAKDATRINLYGRTDSKVADQGNTVIAAGRSEAAKNYLVNHGVSADIIRTSFLAAGDFIAPASMEEGRRLNRRVTIEIFTQ